MKKELWVASITSVIGVVSMILYAILTSCGIFANDWTAWIKMLGYFVCVWVPILLWLIKIKLDLTSIIFYEIFIVLSLLVGSVWHVYGYLKYYDVVMHAISGALIAILSYSLFKCSKKQDISLVWLFVLVFAVAMACGGIWEIMEFSIDGITGSNSQIFEGLLGRQALVDTMTDIICDFVGGIVGAIVVVLLERKKRQNKTLENVEKVEEKE